MKTYKFNGIELKKGYFVGLIYTGDIIKKWNEDELFAWWQRLKINKRDKILSIQKIYENNQRINPVVLNFKGSILKEQKMNFKLKGDFTVIDGQQRLRAIYEGKIDTWIPVEIHLNLSLKEELEYYTTLNHSTALTNGDLIWAQDTFLAKMIRKESVSKKTPIKINRKGRRGGLSLLVYTPLLQMIYTKIILNKEISLTSGRPLVTFVQSVDDKKKAILLIKCLRKLLQFYVDEFGLYHPNSLSYNRVFIIAWFKVMINNFINEKGEINFKINKVDFEKRVKNTANMIINVSKTREFIKANADSQIKELHNLIVSYINSGLSKNKLPLYNTNGEFERTNR